MRERPLLFNEDMIKAYLGGRKGQTRRVIKNPDYYCCLTGDCPHEITTQCDNWMRAMSPYGQLGERLWIKERWGYHGSATGGGGGNVINVSYKADGLRKKIKFKTFKNMTDAAPKQNIKFPDGYDDLSSDDATLIYDGLLAKWWKRKQSIPSIHMFRWASRINLQITNIRFERVQDITEEDALGEGIIHWEKNYENDFPAGFKDYLSDGRYPAWCDTAKDSFRTLWDSINAHRGYPWESNPYVWVIDFPKFERGK